RRHDLERAITGREGALHVAELAEQLALNRLRLDFQLGCFGRSCNDLRALRVRQTSSEEAFVEIEARGAHESERHPFALAELLGQRSKRQEVLAPLAPPSERTKNGLQRLVSDEPSVVIRLEQ